MSTVFLLFFGLLDLSVLSVSIPNCDWAYIGGEFIALNVCQKHLREEANSGNQYHIAGSFVMECTLSGNGLQYRYFPETETCDESTHSWTEDVSDINPYDTFNCNINKVYCTNDLYLIYRTYEPCSPNNTANTSYRELNLMSNTCLSDAHLQTSQYITCTSSSYSITTYSGLECQDTKEIGTETIENNDCIEMIYCPESIGVTEFFTTEAREVRSKCSFINHDGSGHRTDVCHVNMANTQIYSYKYECNDIGDTVTYNYYEYTSDCDNAAIISMPIGEANVIDFECISIEDTVCNASDYMQLRLYTVDGGCSADDLVTFDEDRMNEYIVVDIVVEECLRTIHGNYCMFECNNNDADQEEGYFSIKYYDNADCVGESIDSSGVFNDIDCYNNKVSHMIWCDGSNNISYNESDDESYIIDCNYFIDDYIGRPLDVCADQVIAGESYSFEYKCNAHQTGIDKYWYLNKGCNSYELVSIELTQYVEFYCDSVYSCFDIDGYNSMLVAKHYTNTSCNISEDFYYIDYIIVDECWPINEVLFSKATCDNEWYTTTLYTNDCNIDSEFRFIQYDIDDVCLWSQHHVDIVYCPNWYNVTWRPPTNTPTPSPTYDETLLDCKWININGNARRIDVCNVAPYGDIKWSYRYECAPNTTGVVQRWYRHSDNCDGYDFFDRDLTHQATSYNCNSDAICSNYVRIMTYDSPECAETEYKYVTSESIIDECFIDNYNESTLIKCDPHGNGYIIYEYHDANCHDEYLWQVIPVAHKICQSTSQRIEVVEECVSAPSVQPTSPAQSMDINYTQCNYFYNGLFGVALDLCQVYKHGDDAYTSVMYKCNDEHNTVIQYQYDGSNCDDDYQIGADDTSYTLFYCESHYICDVVDILQMKWYDNDSCITDEQFWRQSSVIMNVCWPNYDDDTSVVILCDVQNYIIYRYDNLYCNGAFFASIEYQSGTCVDGNTFVIESGCLQCNYWISTDGYGYPMDHCFEIRDTASDNMYHSFKFTCNAAYNGVEQIWYIDSECLDEHDTEIELIPNQNILDIDFADETPALIELVTLKLYHNTNCAKAENSWSQDIVVINKCLETKDAHSRMVSCSTDANNINSFTVQLFEDSNCTHMNNETTMESGDCDETGMKIEIISCGNIASPTEAPFIIMPTLNPTRIASEYTTQVSQETQHIQYNNTNMTGYAKVTLSPTKGKDKDKDKQSNPVLVALNASDVCKNFFGGGDVGGTDCKIIEALVWFIIAAGAVAVGCCCVYSFCSDTVRSYCLYGRHTKDFSEGADSDTDEDNTRDHPRGVLINPSGIKSMHNPSNRKGNVYAPQCRASLHSATSDSDSGHFHDPLDDDDDDDDDQLSPLDENDNAMSSAAQLSSLPNNTISSFNPGTGSGPSGHSGPRPVHHITSSDEDLTSKRISSSDPPRTMSSEVHIHHTIPSHLIGRTIEIENIPIDIMNGVDISAMHHPQQIPSMSSQTSPNRASTMSQARDPLLAAHISNQSSETDIHGIVRHYIHRNSFFATDNDTKTSTDNPSSKHYHGQHSRDHAVDLNRNDSNNNMDDIKEESKEIFRRERNASDTEDNQDTTDSGKGVGFISAFGHSMNDSSTITRTYAVDDGMDHTLHPQDSKDDEEDPPSKSPMQNDLNRLILTGSVHGALSSALGYSVHTDDDTDDDDDDDDQRLGSLPRPTRNANIMHVTNNSLMDPMIATPISHGALVHSEDDEEDDNGNEDTHGTVTGTGTGTVTSALAHSVTTRIVDDNDDDNGTVHDL